MNIYHDIEILKIETVSREEVQMTRFIGRQLIAREVEWDQ
jgi:hypothetical protein